jgi:hypothetical protein
LARTIRDVDLIALIKACGEVGVYKFKYGSLEIEFGSVWPQQKSWGTVDGKPVVGENNEDEVDPLDEALVKEMKVAEALIEDPLLYEQMQLGDREVE